VYPFDGEPGWKHWTSEQVGNGPLHSPDGRQIDSAGPFKPWPGGHENAALPPTSLEMIATRGAVPLADGGIETSPHSTPGNFKKICQILVVFRRFHRLTLTNRQRLTPISTSQALNLRCAYQSIAVVAGEGNLRAELRCSCAQSKSTSRDNLWAMDSLDFDGDCVCVSSRSHASVDARILRFSGENTQTIFKGRISAFFGVPAFGIRSSFTAKYPN
jgi:hypothetical protein